MTPAQTPERPVTPDTPTPTKRERASRNEWVEVFRGEPDDAPVTLRAVVVTLNKARRTMRFSVDGKALIIECRVPVIAALRSEVSHV